MGGRGVDSFLFPQMYEYWISSYLINQHNPGKLFQEKAGRDAGFCQCLKNALNSARRFDACVGKRSLACP